MGQQDPLLPAVTWSGTAGELVAPPDCVYPRCYYDNTPVQLIPPHLTPIMVAISQFDHPRYLLIGVPGGATNRMAHSLLMGALRRHRSSVQLLPADRPFYWSDQPCNRYPNRTLVSDNKTFVVPYDHVIYAGEDMMEMIPYQSAVILRIPPLAEPPPAPSASGSPHGGGGDTEGGMTAAQLRGQWQAPPPPERVRWPARTGRPPPPPPLLPPQRWQAGPVAAPGSLGPLPGPGLRSGLPYQNNKGISASRRRMQAGGYALAMLPRHSAYTNMAVKSTVFWSTLHQLVQPDQDIRLFFTKTCVLHSQVCKVPFFAGGSQRKQRPDGRLEIKNTRAHFLKYGNATFDNMLEIDIV